MIQPKDFFEAMSARGIDFYAGVPDSLLANFCAYVDDLVEQDRHVITANEGNAIALAMGYHMATGKVATVYMQNSGLGNAINPLNSLADPEVYKVPMLLVIGWRGEPETKDEPQHVKQGRVTQSQLDVLEIPHWVIDADSQIDIVLDQAFANIRRRNAPAALLVRKDTFASYNTKFRRVLESTLARETALEQLLQLSADNDLVVATTGKTSREVFELRIKRGQTQHDFLTVGGMGHAASLALGVAIGQPHRRVVCLDGDGSLLMHMGCMPVIAKLAPKRFVHVLLNNQCHESVGGQATAAGVVDFEALAKAVGYAGFYQASDSNSLSLGWRALDDISGPVLLEVKIQNGSRDNLGRPTGTPEQNKHAFIKAINNL